jgi:hypothetical protein
MGWKEAHSSVPSDKSLPSSGHMPPYLEHGANTYFPELLGVPDEIIDEGAL